MSSLPLLPRKVYTTGMDGIAAILVGAGLSSRGGSFRPLMHLNGIPMIELALQSILDAAIHTTCVITKHESNEIEAALDAFQHELSHRNSAHDSKSDHVIVKGLDDPKAQDIRICYSKESDHDLARNLAAAYTALNTASAATCGSGVSDASSPYQAVFIVPGDAAGVSAHTYVALAHYALDHQAPIVVPTYNGKRGRLLLLDKSILEELPLHAGTGGLQDMLSHFPWHELAVDDPGVVLGAESPPALETLAAHVRKTRGVSEEIVDELFSLYETPDNVRAHTAAVALVANRMARMLNTFGYGLDSGLCWAGGALHDVNRLEPHHSKVGEENLRELGYDALATVVAAHDQELVMTPCMFTEANLVFVADKLVKETTLVSISRRYEGAFKRFPRGTTIGNLIERDSKNAMMLLDEYASLTGDDALLKGTTDFVRRSHHAKT